MILPKKVFLREEGPREGFQIHPQVIPTEQKVALIDRLSKTGIKNIEVTSFVRPDLVPQLADAEEVVKQFNKEPGIRYRALTLNEKGFLRALRHNQKLELDGSIHISPSELFLKKNNNLTLQKALAGIPNWLKLFRNNNISLDRLMVSAAFGDNLEGIIAPARTLKVIEETLVRINDEGDKLDEVTLADTTGWANPESVRQLIGEINNRWPNLIVGLHLHDTRGTGMANVYAGLIAGVTRFDCSVAGMGGCPFTLNAAGNVPTEDVAFLCQQLGIETGINLELYIECAKFAETILEKKLPGKLKDGGLIKS